MRIICKKERETDWYDMNEITSEATTGSTAHQDDEIVTIHSSVRQVWSWRTNNSINQIRNSPAALQQS